MLATADHSIRIILITIELATQHIDRDFSAATLKVTGSLAAADAGNTVLLTVKLY